MLQQGDLFEWNTGKQPVNHWIRGVETMRVQLNSSLSANTPSCSAISAQAPSWLLTLNASRITPKWSCLYKGNSTQCPRIAKVREWKHIPGVSFRIDWQRNEGKWLNRRWSSGRSTCHHKKPENPTLYTPVILVADAVTMRLHFGLWQPVCLHDPRNDTEWLISSCGLHHVGSSKSRGPGLPPLYYAPSPWSYWWLASCSWISRDKNCPRLEIQLEFEVGDMYM